MSQFGQLYANYYDLMYADKNYMDEVRYVEIFIKKHCPSARALLDIGCGTGRHAEIFADMGYDVLGFDCSLDMLKKAETRRTGKESRLVFASADVSSFRLDKKFDVAVSLFHVFSYLNSNQDLVGALTSVKNHLNPKGILIFDFWYGPAVLSDPPVTRVRRLENDTLKVTRIAEPKMNAQLNKVDVHYDIFLEDKTSGVIFEQKEKHPMRYYFDPELEFALAIAGFKLLEKRAWLSNDAPGYDSWNVMWVVQC